MDSSKYITSLCNAVINNSKDKKLDLHSIFRTLTNPKSRVKADFSKLNIGELDSDDPEMREFIATVNPFYDFKSKIKNGYYAQHYQLSQMLLENCQDLLKERNTINHYCIKITNTNHLMCYDDLQDENYDKYKTDLARYKTKEEALEKGKYYLSIYRYLEIERNLTLLAMNKQEEILEEEVI